MPDQFALQLQQRLAAQQQQHLTRTRRVFEKRDGSFAVVDGKRVINFCSYDYLHLATDERVKKAFAESASVNGLGSSGSALISGYSAAHERLEIAFAEFLQRDSALLFNSGYHANLGVLTALAGKDGVIIADKYAHASLNAGAQLSRANFLRYRHQDLQQAEDLLQRQTTTLLVTESIFSMQGTLSNIPALTSLAKKYHATLVVDDAHGVGVLGKHGAGVCEHFQLSQQDVPCLITPLGKAFGSFGAIVSGESALIEALIQFAGSYRYCTALPPAICDATLTALTIMHTETWRREKLQHLCEFFIREANARHLPQASDDVTPIRTIIIGDNKKTETIQQTLLQKGLLVSCIRPPTVPANKACVRIPLSVAHSETQIIYLLDCLKEAYDAR